MLKNDYVDEDFGFEGEDEEFDFGSMEEEIKVLKKQFKKRGFRGKRLYIAG